MKLMPPLEWRRWLLFCLLLLSEEASAATTTSSPPSATTYVVTTTTTTTTTPPLAVATVAPATARPQIFDYFRFTRPSYNVSIPENSIGKTYVLPEEMMGVSRTNYTTSYDVKYRIVAGDKDKFFKAEERVVGDFSFLLLRTRTGNNDVLNRERKDKYALEVRATLVKRPQDGGKGGGKTTPLSEADCTVLVTILDTNDLNPLFYPTVYEHTVTEDTPLHRSILRVIAEDADLGINGEIYYRFAEETDQFAIHPITGILTLIRPLR